MEEIATMILWTCTTCKKEKPVKEIKQTFYIGQNFDQYGCWAICNDCHEKKGSPVIEYL